MVGDFAEVDLADLGGGRAQGIIAANEFYGLDLGGFFCWHYDNIEIGFAGFFCCFAYLERSLRE